MTDVESKNDNLFKLTRINPSKKYKKIKDSVMRIENFPYKREKWVETVGIGLVIIKNTVQRPIKITFR